MSSFKQILIRFEYIFSHLPLFATYVNIISFIYLLKLEPFLLHLQNKITAIHTSHPRLWSYQTRCYRFETKRIFSIHRQTWKLHIVCTAALAGCIIFVVAINESAFRPRDIASYTHIEAHKIQFILRFFWCVETSLQSTLNVLVVLIEIFYKHYSIIYLFVFHKWIINYPENTS